MVKQTPMPNEQFFEWFFNSDLFFSSRQTEKAHIWGYYDYFADESNRLATSRWRYKKLSHLFSGGPLNMMKIGPATGTFLHVAQENGHKVLGCDVSNTFAQYARDTYNVQIDQGRFEKQGYRDGQFDVVILLNVIENVPNQQEFLENINRTIRPGGYFIFNYVKMDGNLIAKLQKSKYFIYRPPICYTYTRPVMHEVLRKFNFEVVETHRDVRTLNIEKVLTLLGWRGVLRLAKFIKINRLPFRLYAYPSQIVVARKIEG
jgi:2-polyprenyl-3-methyl-5-hydroxy-6-metoxy-1,4-benzoquinol methylase